MAAAMPAGAAAALGLAPIGLWPLTLAALLVVSVLFATATGPRQSALIGWAFGLGYFALGLAWIVEPFLVDPERHGWMAPFALVFLAGGLALFWGAAFAAAGALGRTPGGRVWALVLTWTLAEFARGYVLTGFPWAGLAQVWVDTDAALALAWIGPQGLALATLLATLPAGLALVPAVPARRRLALLLPALGLVAAIFALGRITPEIGMTGATVRLVQPNARQDQKWDPAMIPVFFRRQVAFTAAPAADGSGRRPDLIVWPETAIPTLLNNAGDTLAVIADAAAGVPVVLGVQRLDGDRVYNSLILLGPDGGIADLYDKHHLVPFGEYIPAGDIAARFGLRGFAAQDGDGFSAGPGPHLIGVADLGRALPLICYEAVFPQDMFSPDGRADFLLQITNDAWFGRNSGPYQHLAQARMRAIEQGLPMVRAANTGISAMIDPLGRVTDSLALGTAGFIDTALPAPLPAPLYARTGDLPLLLLLLAAVPGFLVLRRAREARI